MNKPVETSVSGVARAIGVTQPNVVQWIAKGWLPAPDDHSRAWPRYTPGGYEVAVRMGRRRLEGEMSASGKTYEEAAKKLAKLVGEYLEPMEDFPDSADDVRIELTAKVIFEN